MQDKFRQLTSIFVIQKVKQTQKIERKDKYMPVSASDTISDSDLLANQKVTVKLMPRIVLGRGRTLSRNWNCATAVGKIEAFD